MFATIRLAVVAIASLLASACAGVVENIPTIPDGVGARLAASDAAIMSAQDAVKDAVESDGFDFDIRNPLHRDVVYRSIDVVSAAQRGEISTAELATTILRIYLEVTGSRPADEASVVDGVVTAALERVDARNMPIDVEPLDPVLVDDA